MGVVKRADNRARSRKFYEGGVADHSHPIKVQIKSIHASFNLKKKTQKYHSIQIYLIEVNNMVS